jgi:hypothetical protein
MQKGIQMQEKTNIKDRVSIEFSNKQLFNRREVTKQDGTKVNLVSIALPTTSQYRGFSYTANADYVYQSKYNKNMSYTYLLANKDITIRKYDKETETSEEKVLTVDELKKEFRSWQTKNKAKENTSKSEKQGQEISSPVYEEPDKDYEPIDM